MSIEVQNIQKLIEAMNKSKNPEYLLDALKKKKIEINLSQIIALREIAQKLSKSLLNNL